MLQIDLFCPRRYRIDRETLKRTARVILTDAEIRHGELSLAVVDQQQMRELHRRFLQQNSPTDVLSFRLDDASRPEWIEGEVVACWDVAAEEAARIGWRPEEELLLYVIHGCLHLVGYEDESRAKQRRMREAECYYLAKIDPRLADHHAKTTRTTCRANRPGRAT